MILQLFVWTEAAPLRERFYENNTITNRLLQILASILLKQRAQFTDDKLLPEKNRVFDSNGELFCKHIMPNFNKCYIKTNLSLLMSNVRLICGHLVYMNFPIMHWVGFIAGSCGFILGDQRE